LLTVADGGRRWSVRGPVPLLGREWVLAAAMVDLANGRIAVHQASLARDGGRDRTGTATGGGPAAIAWPAATPLVLAAQGTGLDKPLRATSHHLN
ncbi:hypothetical protein AB0165_29665, partial [Klebsiella variicola]|uniref:hypothetical protein n=1 Tax=Klebsiella variicola TaxID=244366 RepID=UPI00344D9D31